MDNIFQFKVKMNKQRTADLRSLLNVTVETIKQQPRGTFLYLYHVHVNLW